MFNACTVETIIFEKQYAREEGREEGIMEVTRKVAEAMKKEGINLDTIAKTTCLSREEIEKL